jgi:hypothetical protein
MDKIVSGIVGFVVGAVLVFYFSLSIQLQTNALASRAQGQVDVMTKYCKGDLEKVGLIKKEKKDE